MTDVRAGQRGLDCRQGTGILSLFRLIHTRSGAHPAFCKMGTRVLFPGVKPPEREADHIPPSRANVKIAWSIYFHGVAIR
jgi:hypothetical protein